MSRTQGLRWIPVLIFSAGRLLFHLQISTKARNRPLPALRTGVAPARMPCGLRDQPCKQYASSRGTCAERSSIRRRDGLDLAPAQIKRNRNANSTDRLPARIGMRLGQQQGHRGNDSDLPRPDCTARLGSHTGAPRGVKRT